MKVNTDRWSGRPFDKRGPAPGSRRAPRTDGSTGFRCPKCDGPTVVKDSRQDVDGSVKRRRTCTVCAKRTITYETSADGLTRSEREQFKLFLNMLPKLRELADSIDLFNAEHE